MINRRNVWWCHVPSSWICCNKFHWYEAFCDVLSDWTDGTLFWNFYWEIFVLFQKTNSAHVKWSRFLQHIHTAGVTAVSVVLLTVAQYSESSQYFWLLAALQIFLFEQQHTPGLRVCECVCGQWWLRCPWISAASPCVHANVRTHTHTHTHTHTLWGILGGF